MEAVTHVIIVKSHKFTLQVRAPTIEIVEVAYFTISVAEILAQ